MIIYPLILALSLIGIFFITRPHRKEARSYAHSELQLKMATLSSVRSDIKLRLIDPVLSRTRELVLPVFKKSFERFLGRVRNYVSALEAKLNGISEDIHGTAINLEVPQKSEYWNSLNIAKTSAHHDIIPKRNTIK